MRRLSYIAVGIWFALLSGLAMAKSPNVLLFLADDMTYTDLGCYGNEDVQTPNLDRFASESLKLTRCFNTAPMCSPLRQSLYTGLYPVRNGAYPNHSRVYPWVRSLPHHLKEHGYRTAILGKRHEAPDDLFPFENLGGRHHDNGKGIDLDLTRLDDFLRDVKEKDDPFCLVVASNQPHRPWNRGDASAYDPKVLSVPANLVDTTETRQGLVDYYAEITYMDGQFGRCLESLEQMGLKDDTVVIFLSEQGSNFPFCKWTCYSTGIRSACLIRWPGKVQPRSSSAALVSYVDIVPTLVELAAGRTDSSKPEAFDFDGESLVGLLYGGSLDHREFVFAVQTSRGIYHGPDAYGIRAVTDGRFLLIHNLNHENSFRNSVVHGDKIFRSWKKAASDGDAFADSRSRRYLIRPEYELFDLDADPWNLHDLAGDVKYRSKQRSLAAALDQWMGQQGDLGIATELSATERQVK